MNDPMQEFYTALADYDAAQREVAGAIARRDACKDRLVGMHQDLLEATVTVVKEER